jgi:hypothetical protein
MDYPPLSEFIAPSEYATVAGSRLFEDFAPTRDKSMGNSSIFTYKAMAYENEGSTTERGALERFVPTLFGEIDLIQVMNLDRHPTYLIVLSSLRRHRC